MPGLVARLHHRYVHRRRVRVLADELAGLVPPGSHVLDVGCGDGTIDRAVMDRAPTTSYTGIDVKARPTCAIPCTVYDGTSIPHPDRSFDVVQFIDVLHHADDIERVFAEAVRVTRRHVILKDHSFANRFEYALIKGMDWIGNAPHGVRLPYNFQDLAGWRALVARHGLEIRAFRRRVPLYPYPFSELFGRDGMDFVMLLERR